jgi:hypothetical protein
MLAAINNTIAYWNQNCCSLCWLIGLIFVLITFLSFAVDIPYIVLRPKEPKYFVDDINIKGIINITLLSFKVAISLEFDVFVRTNNPNDEI